METTTPQTLIEAIRVFSNPDYAFAYLVKMRWANGVACPRCGCMEPSFISTRKIWKCTKGCKKQFSVKVGTILENSALGLDKWLTAIWLIASAKNGISSYELARSIGVKQESAWHMLHRIRAAMEVGSLEKMKGTVEVDETVIGGKAKGMHADRRQVQRAKGFPKVTVLGFRERDGDVRTMVVPDTTKETLQGKIEANVTGGANVYTDSWKSYKGMEGYQHGFVNHNIGQYVDGDVSTNGIENYWSIFKRCYHGTYIHFADYNVKRYLHEEDFRFNTRKMKDGLRFNKLLGQIAGKRLTYAELTESHLERLI